MTKYRFDIPGFKGYQLDLVTRVIYNKFNSRIRVREDQRGTLIVSMNGTSRTIDSLVESVIKREMLSDMKRVVVEFKNNTCYVYHVRRLGMNIEEGYVGVSSEPKKRFRSHTLGKKSSIGGYFQKYRDIEIELIFEGTRTECLTKERELRPRPHMGWNIATGGGQPWSAEWTMNKISKNIAAGRPENSGLKWDKVTETLMVYEWYSGMSLEELSNCLQREPSAVTTRLKRLKAFKKE